MIKKIFITIIFLGLTHFCWTQCNPLEYERLFKEAQSLQEKNQLEESKSMYEAAKIYACNMRQKNAADESIDKLFEKSRSVASESVRKAMDEKDKAIANQQAAMTRIALNVLQDAKMQIYHLDYDSALLITKDAIILNAVPQKVADVLLEITFFYSETGEIDRAIGILDIISSLSVFDSSFVHHLKNLKNPTINDCRDIIKTINPDLFEFFNLRYFPEMLLISGSLVDPKTIKSKYTEKQCTPDILSSFKISKTEVTWWQYFLFCKATGKEMPRIPGWGLDGDNPVVNVFLADLVEYLNWLSKYNNLEKAIVKKGDNFEVHLFNGGYRLPTLTEWKYAAGMSMNYRFSGSDTIDQVAWYGLNSRNRTHPVGRKKANINGLMDMSGNAWEWCWEWWPKIENTQIPPISIKKDPSGPTLNSWLVLQGGSWDSDLNECLIKNTEYINPQLDMFGFRVVQGQ
jgi:formylglycine-generating enzyme required for sulfatase activity